MTNSRPASRLLPMPAHWPVALVLASTAGSYVFACIAPLVAIATIATITTSRRRALATVAAAWLANQTVGYGLLDYPVDANSLGWGLAIGAASLIALLAAEFAIDRLGRAGSAARHVAGFGAAFAAYEISLFVVSLALGGTESFSPAIVAAAGTVNAVALTAMALLHRAVATGSAAPARAPVPPASRQAT